MIDSHGRIIDYMRISITDRCNLRCQYCMPDNTEVLSHMDILRFEEIIRICQCAVRLGIKKFKVTGGEPLVRKGCIDFLKELKQMPGVEQVTLTTLMRISFSSTSLNEKRGGEIRLLFFRNF